MGLGDLTQLEILEGSTSLIYAIVGTIIGAIIASKYITYKRQELLWIGISIALSCVPWYSAGITFLTIIFFNFELDVQLYLFINYGFITLALITWMYGISILLFPKLTKKIVSLFLVICIPYEILFIYYLLVDPSLIGTKEGILNSDAALMPTIFVIFTLLIILITMLLFIRECLISKNLKIKWQGRFLLIGLILMIIGSLVDTMITISIVTLMTARTFLIARLIFSYLGWLLPDRIAKWLIKDNK